MTPAVLIGLGLMLTLPAQAVQIARFKVALSTRDATHIGATACGGRHESGTDSISAYSLKRGSRVIEVDVQCKPHRIDTDGQVVRRARCSNISARWTCDSGYEATLVPLDQDETVAVVVKGFDSRRALGVFREAINLTVPPFHNPARFYISGTCVVTSTGLPVYEGAVEFRIDCTNGSLAAIRHCRSNKCRTYIAKGDRNTE